MKLIIKDDLIAATATDDYQGPEPFIPAPPGFDIQRLAEYRLVAGELEIPVPAVVSMRQARLALLGAGLLAQVNSAVAAMPGIEGEAARIEWEFAAEVRRDSPLVSLLSGALGLVDEHLDALFVQADRL